MVSGGLCEFSCGRCECDDAAVAATTDVEDADAGVDADVLCVLEDMQYPYAPHILVLCTSTDQQTVFRIFIV